MSSRFDKRTLQNIPSLPESVMMLKYIKTPDVYYDPNTISNFMKETLRDTGTDAPLFEQDMPRGSRNPMSQSILNSREHGGRYTHAPYHPEMFLGDLSKDQRIATTDPIMSQMVEQNKYRQEKYLVGKLQDVAPTQTEGMVGTKRMLRQIKQGFGDTATRMNGIFDDSSNGMVRSMNPNLKAGAPKFEDTIVEQQKFYKQDGEKILPHYTDIVGALSNDVGIQWDVQPEQKFKISSVSNLYRAKQDVDRAANAVFRLGQQDTAFKEGMKGIKNAERNTNIDNVKAARKNAQNVAVSTNKDSYTNNMLLKVLQPTAQESRVVQSKSTHKMPLVETLVQIRNPAKVDKYVKAGNIQESLMEPIKDTTLSVLHNSGTIPHKDRIAGVYKSLKTHKDTFKENENKLAPVAIKNILTAMKTKAPTMREHVESRVFANVNYGTKKMEKPIDHVSNNKLTSSKFTAPKEHMTKNSKGTNAIALPTTIKAFKFDTDPTMDNKYLTRRGLSQRMGSLAAHQTQDNSISPLSETTTPFRTKYKI